ncbi:MAG TPA: adenine phosphoribosyltransferase [Candidatus Dormibacteraeota bacterium]|jgi:adenine phosphoribosyltransferase
MALRAVPDFPRPGVLFRDITTVISDPVLFHDAVDALADACRLGPVDAVVGIEARGFVLGGAIAYALGAGFVPVRKQGRLPGALESVAYSLEYGEAVLEMHTDALQSGQRVVIVDDLLATGGTASATIDLVERMGATVSRLVFLIELGGLGGAARLGGRRHSSLITL